MRKGARSQTNNIYIPASLLQLRMDPVASTFIGLYPWRGCINVHLLLHVGISENSGCNIQKLEYVICYVNMHIHVLKLDLQWFNCMYVPLYMSCSCSCFVWPFLTAGYCVSHELRTCGLHCSELHLGGSLWQWWCCHLHVRRLDVTAS